MKIALINFSPSLQMTKKEIGATASILQDFRRILRHNHQHDIEEVHVKTGCLTEQQMDVLGTCGIWVIGFPVYMGGLPGHAMEWLKAVEDITAMASPGEIKIYGIGNGCLYEGTSAGSAIQSLRLWCDACEFNWCGGIGIGGGPYYSERAVSQTALGRRRTYMRRLNTFGEACAKGLPILNMTCAPDFTASRYVMRHNRGCRKVARSHGLTGLDMNRQN